MVCEVSVASTGWLACASRSAFASQLSIIDTSLVSASALRGR
jgi:hypothetical protein